MVLLLLICIVAQNGIEFSQMEMKNFYKYKNKSVRLRQAKPKQEEPKQRHEEKKVGEVKEGK